MQSGFIYLLHQYAAKNLKIILLPGKPTQPEFFGYFLILLRKGNLKIVMEDFNRTIDYYIEELDHYDLNILCVKPSSNSWSLGQLYLHLIEETTYYLSQIQSCLTHNNNSTEKSSPEAQRMFRENSFPDIEIQGAPENALIPQPDNKIQLLEGLKNLKNEINKAAAQMLQSPFRGKTKHPGLHYFDSTEWLQFTDMHFRHHLRQKQKIDHYLMENQTRDCKQA